MSGIGGGGVASGETAGIRGARAMFEQMNRQSDPAGAAAALRKTTAPTATAIAAATRSAESTASDRRPFKEVQKQQQQQQQPAGQVAALARQLQNVAAPTASVIAAINGAIGSHGGEHSAVGQGQQTTAAARPSAATDAAAAKATFKQSPTAAPKPTRSVPPGSQQSPKTNDAARNGTDAEGESWPMPPEEMHKLMREMQSKVGKRHEGVCPSQAFVVPTATGDASSGQGTDSSRWKTSPTPPTKKSDATALREMPAVQKTLPHPFGPPVARRPTGFDVGRASGDAAASAGRAPPDGPPRAGAALVATATTLQAAADTSPLMPRTPPPLPVKPTTQVSPSTGPGDSDEPVASSSAGRSVKAMAKLLSNATAAASSPRASDGAARRQVLDEFGVAYEWLPFPTTDMPRGPPPPKPASLAGQLVVLPTLRWAHEKSDSEDGSVDSATKQQRSLSSPQQSTAAVPRRTGSDSGRPPPSGSRQIVSIIEPMQSDEEEYDDALENEVFSPPLPALPDRPAKLLNLSTATQGDSRGSTAASAAVQEGDESDTYDDVGVDGRLYDDAKPEAGAVKPRSESLSSSSSEPKAASLVDRKESKKRQKQADLEALRLKKEEQERLAREQLAMEEERRQREKTAKKAAKVKQALEKDQAKIRKKFKLQDGSEAFIRLATMREAYSPKPGSQELPYSAEEVLYIVVKDGCPKGKWLARNSAKLLGFIACDGVVGSSVPPGELGSPLADPIAEEDEEVEYADAEMDDFVTTRPTDPGVRRVDSGKGGGSAPGGGTSAAVSDDTYDDTGAADSEQNEDIYELAE